MDPRGGPSSSCLPFFSFPGKKKRGQSFLEQNAGPLCRIMAWRPWGAEVSDEEAGQGGDRHKWIDAGGGELTAWKRTETRTSTGGKRRRARGGVGY